MGRPTSLEAGLGEGSLRSRLPPAGGELPRDQSKSRGSLGDRMQRAHRRMLSRNAPSIDSETRGLQVFFPSLLRPPLLCAQACSVRVGLKEMWP